MGHADPPGQLEPYRLFFLKSFLCTAETLDQVCMPFRGWYCIWAFGGGYISVAICVPAIEFVDAREWWNGWREVLRINSGGDN